jgi:quercetin dioxygenase-like cupin family protein
MSSDIGKSSKNEILVKPISLIDVVAYQEKAVVSRTLIDEDAGTVTMFAFDEKQGLSEHEAPFDVLVNILEGEAEVRIGGKPIILKGGEMLIMPSNKPHAIKALTRFKMLLIMIKS